MLRWLVRLAKDREVLTEKQYLFVCQGLAECGRMTSTANSMPSAQSWCYRTIFVAMDSDT